MDGLGGGAASLVGGGNGRGDLVGNAVHGVLNLHRGVLDNVRKGVAQLVHALAGQVNLGTKLIGLGVDRGAHAVELVVDDLGAVLIGVDGRVPRVVHGIGGHGAALGARAGCKHHASDDAGSGANKAAQDEGKGFLAHEILQKMRFTCYLLIYRTGRGRGMFSMPQSPNVLVCGSAAGAGAGSFTKFAAGSGA